MQGLYIRWRRVGHAIFAAAISLSDTQKCPGLRSEYSSHLIKYTMLKIPLSFIPWICLALVACGNSSDEPKQEPTATTISVTPEALTVSDAAGTSTLKILANADWSITSDADWCTVFPSGGVKNQTVEISLKYGANKDSWQPYGVADRSRLRRNQEKFVSDSDSCCKRAAERDIVYRGCTGRRYESDNSV